MAVRSIKSQAGTSELRASTPSAVDIQHDTDDKLLKYKDSAGTVQVVPTRAVPGTIVSPTFTNPTRTGTETAFAAAAAAGSAVEVSKNATVLNNTATDFFTVTVPNAIVGASIDLLVSSTLGDGDSTDTARYTVGISRLTGAAAKAAISAKSVVGATAGAGANAVITAAVSAIAGAVGAVNTFTITITNARSAGAADNHPTTAIARLLNNKATGITIAAA